MLWSFKFVWKSEGIINWEILSKNEKHFGQKVCFYLATNYSIMEVKNVFKLFISDILSRLLFRIVIHVTYLLVHLPYVQ